MPNSGNNIAAFNTRTFFGKRDTVYFLDMPVEGKENTVIGEDMLNNDNAFFRIPSVRISQCYSSTRCCSNRVAVTTKCDVDSGMPSIKDSPIHSKIIILDADSINGIVNSIYHPTRIFSLCMWLCIWL